MYALLTVLDNERTLLRFCDSHYSVSGYLSELLRHAKLTPSGNNPSPAHFILPFLTKLVNTCSALAHVPVQATASLVTSFHTKGDVAGTADYRPVAMCDPVIRMYALVLNDIIVGTPEGNSLRLCSQAGFRPKLSTLHPPFTFQQVVGIALFEK